MTGLILPPTPELIRPAPTAISDEVLDRVLPAQRENFIRFVDNAYEKLAQIEHRTGHQSRLSAIYRHAVEIIPAYGNTHKLRALKLMNKTPCSIDEFVESKEFLGGLQEVWPLLRPDLRRINPDVMLGETPCHEALLGGATGTGKTTTTYTTNAYQVYMTTCFNQPQIIYGLSPVTPIVFMFQSVSQTTTRRIVYRPFRELFTAMPHAKRYITWNKYRESDLQLSNGVQVVPALANLEAILGQAIAGCILDEVNFMKLIHNSTQVAGNRGQGGKFDQAREVYTNITRRRQRSFQTKSYSMGVLCILSSTRYKSDFLDQRISEVQQHSLSNVVVLRHKQYEVVPQDRFSGAKFKLLVGTDAYPTRVLADHEEAGVDYPERGTVELVPVEYRDRFLTDPDGALRDIVGVATDTIAPFIAQRHKIVEATLRHKTQQRPNLVVKSDVELAIDGMPQWNEEVINAMSEAEKARPRWVHIDLSVSGDACGVSVTALMGFTSSIVDEQVQVQPVFSVDAAVSIKPNSTHHIDIAEVRSWIMQLALYYGLNIEEVTYDGFQSTESIQVLRKAGIRSRQISMDRDTEAYENVRRCIYQDRVMLCVAEMLRVELGTLEYNAKTRKVDHPPNGSKDAADAVAGSLMGAATSRKVRSQTRTVTTDGTAAKTKHATERPAGSQALRDRRRKP